MGFKANTPPKSCWYEASIWPWQTQLCKSEIIKSVSNQGNYPLVEKIAAERRRAVSDVSKHHMLVNNTFSILPRQMFYSRWETCCNCSSPQLQAVRWKYGRYRVADSSDRPVTLIFLMIMIMHVCYGLLALLLEPMPCNALHGMGSSRGRVTRPYCRGNVTTFQINEPPLGCHLQLPLGWSRDEKVCRFFAN